MAPKDSKRLQKAPKGSKRFSKVKKGSKRMKNFQKEWVVPQIIITTIIIFL